MANDCINARTVLWYCSFFGFAVNYMLQVNINIAIVDMVASRKDSNETNEANSSSLTLPKITDGRFEWDENEQSLVLGSFYWLHWATQLPGGILAQKYGPKKVFGLSQLISSLLCFTVPAASYFHFRALLFVRLLQGLVAGLTWPAMHTMTGKWIPPVERSKFLTSYLGASVGTVTTYPVSGLLIDWFGWHSVFYVSGILGVLWYMFWFFLVFDSPGGHPRISEKERKYIEDSLGQSSQKIKLKTPWKALLTSLPLWLNVLAQWGGLWGLLTVLTLSPTYFNAIHGWDMRAAGVFSGLPHLTRLLFALMISALGDYFLRRKLMTRNNVRKYATAICLLGQAATFSGLALVGRDAISAIILMTICTMVHGAMTTGSLACLVDIAPNFAGVSCGISSMLALMPGFISPAIVGILTLNNQTVGQWRIIFLISAGVSLICGLPHLLFSDSDVQWWNSPEMPKDREEGEPLQPMEAANIRPIVVSQKEK